ncbi:MAG TPA: hypothetical protein EYG68_12705, partial [Leucothrix mucor]|nr:hypothetical protein [Leucothrix mucor]
MGNEGTAYSQNGSTTETTAIGKAEGHTQYAQHAKRRKLAIEKIVNHRRFLFKEDLDQTALEQKILQNITPYLVSTIDTTQSPLQEQINALENDPNKDAANQLKIDEKKARLSEYKNNYLVGVETYQQSHADMQVLDDNDAVFSKVFLPPPDKQHEYRYIIDTETCKYLCHEHDLAKDATLIFSI